MNPPVEGQVLPCASWIHGSLKKSALKLTGFHRALLGWRGYVWMGAIWSTDIRKPRPASHAEGNFHQGSHWSHVMGPNWPRIWGSLQLSTAPDPSVSSVLLSSTTAPPSRHGRPGRSGTKCAGNTTAIACSENGPNSGTHIDLCPALLLILFESVYIYIYLFTYLFICMSIYIYIYVPYIYIHVFHVWLWGRRLVCFSSAGLSCTIDR